MMMDSCEIKCVQLALRFLSNVCTEQRTLDADSVEGMGVILDMLAIKLQQEYDKD